MSNTNISSLNSSVYTRTTSYTVMTRPVPQHTCNVHTSWKEQVIPQPEPVLIKHLRLPNNFGNNTQLLAHIFFLNPQRILKNPPASTQISWESKHKTMGIEDDDNNDELLELNNDNESNFIYYNSEDKARFEPEVVANTEKNDNKIESKSYLEVIDETIVARPTGRQ